MVRRIRLASARSRLWGATVDCLVRRRWLVGKEDSIATDDLAAGQGFQPFEPGSSRVTLARHAPALCLWIGRYRVFALRRVASARPLRSRSNP